jgi:phosphate starvation-inducible protein PhoH and related proteins
MAKQRAPKKERPTKKVTRQEMREARRSKGNATEITPGASPELDQRTPPRRLECRTQAQYNYLQLMQEKVLTIGDGPAGTGKTFVATKWACEELAARRISKIIVTRPAVEAGGEKLGFLPGELEEKFAPWFEPFRRIMVAEFGETHLENLMKRGRIEVAPMCHLRGLTFEDAVVILDEAQNSTPMLMKLFLTRIGENCHVIVNGDVDQKDIPGKSGLEDAIERLETMEGVGRLQFTEDDIVRSGFVRDLLKRYRKFDDATAALAAREEIGAGKPARTRTRRTPAAD